MSSPATTERPPAAMSRSVSRTKGLSSSTHKIPVLYAEIVDKVKSVSAQPIKYLLNTHQHGDHTGSNAQFPKTTEILMHRNARANMLKSNLPGPGRIVYTDQQSVFLGSVEVQMRYLGRGHTNGDSVIYFPDLRTVHTGDLVVWGKRSQGTTLTPFMDYNAGSGSGKEWVTTLDNLLKLDFDAAIPGHGPVLTKDEVRTFRNKMQTLNERMAALIKAGGQKTDIAAKLKLDDLELAVSARCTVWAVRRTDKVLMSWPKPERRRSVRPGVETAAEWGLREVSVTSTFSRLARREVDTQPMRAGKPASRRERSRSERVAGDRSVCSRSCRGTRTTPGVTRARRHRPAHPH